MHGGDLNNNVHACLSAGVTYNIILLQPSIPVAPQEHGGEAGVGETEEDEPVCCTIPCTIL